MRYLFFDIECCNGKNICSFGYVITDAEFNLLQKEDIIINPQAEFKLSRSGFNPNIKLAYDEQEFLNAESFPFHYERIKEILMEGNQIVCGHAVNNDAVFLKTACLRYKLPQLSYYFADSQKIYYMLGAGVNFSLEKISENLKVELMNLHKSDDDAHVTMLVVKAICKILRLSLKELIEICPSVVANTQDGIIKKSNASSGKVLKRLVKDIQPGEGEYSGKRIAFSENLEKHDTIKVWSLIKEFTSKGGVYTNLADTSDIFVKAKNADCKRLRSARAAKAEIVDIFEFAKRLGMDFSPFDFESVKGNNTAVKAAATVGDMLKERGFDLSSLDLKDTNENNN
ncbi:MAG: exonuclease domain-containing protein [Christensenellales bacterium]